METRIEPNYECRHRLLCDTQYAMPMSDGTCGNCGGIKFNDGIKQSLCERVGKHQFPENSIVEPRCKVCGTFKSLT